MKYIIQLQYYFGNNSDWEPGYSMSNHENNNEQMNANIITSVNHQEQQIWQQFHHLVHQEAQLNVINMKQG